MENFSGRHCGGIVALFCNGAQYTFSHLPEEKAVIASKVKDYNLYLFFHSSATVWSHWSDVEN